MMEMTRVIEETKTTVTLWKMDGRPSGVRVDTVGMSLHPPSSAQEVRGWSSQGGGGGGGRSHKGGGDGVPMSRLWEGSFTNHKARSDQTP